MDRKTGNQEIFDTQQLLTSLLRAAKLAGQQGWAAGRLSTNSSRMGGLGFSRQAFVEGGVMFGASAGT